MGILLGFAAALFISVSYLCSRGFSARHPGRSLELLLVAHCLMAVMALGCLPLLWPRAWPPAGLWWKPLVACTLSYMAAQLCLFIALQRADASWVSPLLGIKVVFVAILSSVWLGGSYTVGQWAAVAMTVCAALLLGSTASAVSRRGWTWVMAACAGYAVSDVYIRQLVEQFVGLGTVRGPMLAACLSYLLCGGLAAACLPGLRTRPTPAMWRGSLPFAATWFAAMPCLYACFALIGVVYGVIIQSTRGIFSIALASLAVRLGHEHLETRLHRMMVLRRVAAALLMTGAIAAFALAG